MSQFFQSRYFFFSDIQLFAIDCLWSENNCTNWLFCMILYHWNVTTRCFQYEWTSNETNIAIIDKYKWAVIGDHRWYFNRMRKIIEISRMIFTNGNSMLFLFASLLQFCSHVESWCWNVFPFRHSQLKVHYRRQWPSCTHRDTSQSIRAHRCSLQSITSRWFCNHVSELFQKDNNWCHFRLHFSSCSFVRHYRVLMSSYLFHGMEIIYRYLGCCFIDEWWWVAKIVSQLKKLLMIAMGDW